MGTAPAAPRENALTPTAAPAPSAPSPAAPAPPPLPGPERPRCQGRRGARGAWEHYRGALTSADFLFAVLTALLTLASWLLFLAGGPPAVVAGLGIAGALAGGIPIAVGALRGLLAREMNVDELVTIAIGASIYVGEYWGAALVAFMMLFGKVLEDVTAARAEQALEGFGQLVPATAQVLDAAQPGGPEGSGVPGGERTVPVGDLRPGDVVLVRPGERVPVDGRVVSGRAAVEEAAITGESLPAEKGPGAEVFAGTLATGGALQVSTTRTGEGTALGRIATLVKEAEAERAPIVRTADRWARWFTPAVLALAGVVWLVTGEPLPAVTVLVVACPCALVLATPTAIVAGVARGARSGILIKGGARLEAAGRVDAVCLDKTGTLTAGRPVLRRVIPFDGLSEHTLLAYAAGAERLSEHPLSRAVLAGAAERGIATPLRGRRTADSRPSPGGASPRASPPSRSAPPPGPETSKAQHAQHRCSWGARSGWPSGAYPGPLPVRAPWRSSPAPGRRPWRWRSMGARRASWASPTRCAPRPRRRCGPCAPPACAKSCSSPETAPLPPRPWPARWGSPPRTSTPGSCRRRRWPS